MFRNFLLICLSSLSGLAEDVTTIDGTTYVGITIREVKPCSVRIFHSEGAVSISSGNLPDDFLIKHEVLFAQCDEFASERGIALQEKKLKEFIASKTPIILPDGSEVDSSKIIGYDPIRVVFMLDGGPKGVDPTKLPKSLRVITGYSEESAREFRAYLREEEKLRNQRLARIKELQRQANLEKRRRDELDRLLKLPLSSPSASRGSSYGNIWVNGYYRKDGTHVRGHYRSR